MTKYIDPFFDTLAIKMLGKLPVTCSVWVFRLSNMTSSKKIFHGGKTIIDVYRRTRKTSRLRLSDPGKLLCLASLCPQVRHRKKKRSPGIFEGRNYQVLKANADRLTTVIGPVNDEIKNSEKGKY